MANRVVFNVQQAIAFAWQFLWADNLAMRAKGNDFKGNTYYLTARDLEVQVRALADETAQGKAWGSTGRGYGGYGFRTRLTVTGGLQHAVRHWLLSNPKLVSHNFKRGHISGARFRPRGEPLSPSEVNTFAQKNKREQQRALGEDTRRVHFRVEGQYANLCVLEQRRKKREAAEAKGHRYFGPMRQSRKYTLSTLDPSEVTCPVCRNLLDKKAA